MKHRLTGVLVLVAIALAHEVLAQRPPENVMIYDGYGQSYQPCEPSIAVSPYNTDWIVAGTILDNVHVSKDGGWTWQSEKLTSKYGVFGDPCIVASPKKDVYYLHLSNPDGRAWSSQALLDRIVIQRARKPGKSWNAGAGMGLNGSKDQDKEWAAVSVDGKQLVTCWTQFDLYGSPEAADSTVILCSTSNRRAKKWSEPVRINAIAGDCLDGDETVEGAVPDFAPDGTIYVAWAQADTIWMDRSSDGGATWLEKDLRVAAIAGGWDQKIRGVGRANGMPVTRVDRSSGPHSGRVYVNWTDNRNGEEDNDVWIVWSDDGGRTWTEPVRVNDDPPGAEQFFTWMDVDDVTGNVHIVFYDRREAAAKEPNPHSLRSWNTEVYVASSYDGGATWENLKVSEEWFRPNAKIFFGDYNNISAHGGVVRPIWTRNDDGVLSVWTAILEGYVE